MGPNGGCSLRLKKIFSDPDLYYYIYICLLMSFTDTSYGIVLEPLVRHVELPPIGPGKPNEARRKALEKLNHQNAFTFVNVDDTAMAKCCVAGVLLLHGFIDNAHEIVQALDSDNAGYWHGLVHRREGDFNNAKYWARIAWNHPIWNELNTKATELYAESQAGMAARFLDGQEKWEPFKFIDLCYKSVGSGSETELLCRKIQQAEWELLFDHSFQKSLNKYSKV